MRISDWSSDVCSSDLHVAGVYARTDIQRGVHKAPANEALRGLYLREIGNERTLSQMINRQRHDIFNPANINIIRDFRSDGRGIRVFGARTFSADPEWRYVSVRRLFLFIEESVEEGTQIGRASCRERVCQYV